MYNKSKADLVSNFIGCLKHVDGKWYGKPFELLDWQKGAIDEFYGTVEKTQDELIKRVYQYLYFEIPKKNGKSELAAALGLYHTFCDGEMHGEVYVCAADKDNASIIYNVAIGMIEQCPFLQKRCKITESKREIIDTVSKTRMKVLSAEAYSKHGYKPSCVIFDELHSQPNRELWDIMTFGAGSARLQPVWIVLTTAGDDPDRKSIGWEIHEKARKIKEYRSGNEEGNYDNPVWLPVMFGLGGDSDKIKDIDIYDEKLWYECNPSLGKTIDIDTLRQEALDAKQSESAERLFRWLRLNQWISTKAVGWLPLTLFDKTQGELPDLIGKKCYSGLDLSTTTDLTALVNVFPPQPGLDKWYVIYQAWITEERMQYKIKVDHVPYDRWKEKGYVKTTPGDCIDFDFIESEIIEASKKYEIIMLGMDPYMSRSISQHISQARINCVEIPQDMKNLSPAMKLIERLMRNDEIEHECNYCARWCFGNVRIATDGNENIKPMKNKSIDRIDVAVAWIIAIATYIVNGEKIDINKKIMSEGWSL